MLSAHEVSVEVQGRAWGGRAPAWCLMYSLASAAVLAAPASCGLSSLSGEVKSSCALRRFAACDRAVRLWQLCVWAAVLSVQSWFLRHHWIRQPSSDSLCAQETKAHGLSPGLRGRCAPPLGVDRHVIRVAAALPACYSPRLLLRVRRDQVQCIWCAASQCWP